MARAKTAKLAPASATVSNVNPPTIGKGFQELGTIGLRQWSGYIWEEFLPQLRGERGRRIFREMTDNDPTVGSVLAAIGLITRAVEWKTVPANDSPEAEKEAEFVKSLLDDMSHSWHDHITEVMTMLSFGWAMFEVVLKRRVGPLETDAAKRSKFKDGRIGIRKLAPRSQDTLLRWELQPDGGIDGMWQQPVTWGPQVFLPINRCVLYRTVSRKNSPEGVSILRSAYTSWYDLKNIERYEAIGIERELAGLPIVRVPTELLTSKNDGDIAVLETYKKIARDLKFNEQGALVLPSNTYLDVNSSPSAIRMVDIDLLSSGGTRTIDTDQVIQRKQRAITRSCLADFLMLGEGSGSSRGSYGMAESKMDFFVRACEAILNQIAYPVNSFVIPDIMDYNNIDRDLQPELQPGRLVKADLQKLGAFIQALAAAGAPLFPDEDLENQLRREADLPEKAPEVAAQQQEQQQVEQEMARQRLEQQTATAQGVQQQAKQPGQQPPQPGQQAQKGSSIEDFPFGIEKGFDPSEPRDEGGKWTQGAGFSGQKATPVSQEFADLIGLKGKPTQSKVRKWFNDKAKGFENHYSLAQQLVSQNKYEDALKVMATAKQEYAQLLTFHQKVPFSSKVVDTAMTQAKAHVESIASFEQHVANLKSSPLDVMTGADAMHGKAPATYLGSPEWDGRPSVSSSIVQDYAKHAKTASEAVSIALGHQQAILSGPMMTQENMVGMKTTVANKYTDLLTKQTQMFNASKNLSPEDQKAIAGDLAASYKSFKELQSIHNNLNLNTFSKPAATPDVFGPAQAATGDVSQATPFMASEKVAVRSYSNSGYISINGALRVGNPGGPSAPIDRIKGIDSALAKTALVKDVTLFRGVGGNYGAALQQLQPGDTFDDRGFISTSKSEQFASTWTSGTLIRIEAKAGQHGLDMNQFDLSSHPSEKEVLLPRGTTFKIMNKKGNVLHVVMI